MYQALDRPFPLGNVSGTQNTIVPKDSWSEEGPTNLRVDRLIRLARPGGLEPPTSGFGDLRSTN
jgi:hypothetical protein